MRRARLMSLAAFALALSASACGGAPTQVRAARAERHAPATVEVSDDAFAGAVRDLLTSEPSSEERKTRLDGVLSRQMSRAAVRFARKDDKDRAMAAVAGGLLLVRTGELRDGAIGPHGKEALSAAVKEAASRGDEGRARALYEILSRASTPAEQPEVQRHLDALSAWAKAGADDGAPVEAAFSTQHEAMVRRLYEPSADALKGAESATVEWVLRAEKLQAALSRAPVRAPQSERIAAFRGLQGGATALVALYLRDGDASGALAALERAKLREWVRPHALVDALEAAKSRPSAEAWLSVLRSILPKPGQGDGDDEDDPMLDRDLLQAAVFGASCEAYRHDPTSTDAARALAESLQSLGMAEASPAVLADGAKAHPDPPTLDVSLALSMRAVAIEADADDADAARRAFKAAKPILDAADAAKVSGVEATPAKLRALMGDVELREGRLEEARALLGAAAASESSGRVLLALARIDQHDNDAPHALAQLKSALGAPDTQKDPSLRAEILLAASEVAQSQGDAAGAKGPLDEALRGLTQARASVKSGERARVERTLARVLDRYGLDQAAGRALERALDAAPNDKSQAGQTLSLVIARAFVRGDLPTAREGLSRAYSADLPTDDLVYAALWVRLLERQQKAKPESGPDKIFATVADDGRWLGRIAAFGAGKIKADELVSSAKTPAQRTEALFYSAMDRRASGDQKGADDGLRQVTASAGVELMETEMARQLLRGKSASFGPPPAGVAIP